MAEGEGVGRSGRRHKGGRAMQVRFTVVSTAVIALMLAAVVAIPVYGATLKVEGKYVGTVIYDGEAAFPSGSITSISPGGITKGVDLLGMSTLYLTFDFAGEGVLKEGMPTEGLFEAHLPLMLFKDVQGNRLSVTHDPDDDYFFVFRGNLFTLSLTDATSGEHAFAGLKDPLGLVREIDTEDTVVLKLTGEPYGMDVLGYLVSAVFTDKNCLTRESHYAAVRATYELPSGLCLGLTCGIRRESDKPGDGKNTGADGDIGPDGDTNPDVNIDIDGNISIDVEVPIPLSKRATLQAALAANTGTKAGNPYEPKGAFSLKVRRLQLGNTAFAGDLIAVEPGFAAVAHKKDSSDAFDYEGKRYLRGEAKTVLQLFGRGVKITLSNERTTNYDGSLDREKGSSKNKVFSEVELGLSSGVTLTADGYLDKTLADTGEYWGDYTTRARARILYKSPEGNEIWGRLWQVAKEHREAQGKAHKFECGVKVKPVTGGKLEGKGGYEIGTLTFPSYTSVGKHTSKLYGEIYGELEHTLMPDDVDQVDILLAGFAKYAHRDSHGPEATLAAYGEMSIARGERFTNKTALLLAKESKKASHYAPTVHNKLEWKVSDNASFALGYTFKKNRGTLDALYSIRIADATLEVGYGKTGLRDECTDTGHTGKPWAWLCSAKIQPKPKLFTLTITIPL